MRPYSDTEATLRTDFTSLRRVPCEVQLARSSITDVFSCSPPSFLDLESGVIFAAAGQHFSLRGAEQPPETALTPRRLQVTILADVAYVVVRVDQAATNN